MIDFSEIMTRYLEWLNKNKKRPVLQVGDGLVDTPMTMTDAPVVSRVVSSSTRSPTLVHLTEPQIEKKEIVLVPVRHRLLSTSTPRPSVMTSTTVRTTTASTMSLLPSTMGVNFTLGLDMDGSKKGLPHSTIDIQGQMSLSNEYVFLIGACGLALLMAVLMFIIIWRTRRTPTYGNAQMVPPIPVPAIMDRVVNEVVLPVERENSVVSFPPLGPPVGSLIRVPYASTPNGRTATLMDDTGLSVIIGRRNSWPPRNREMLAEPNIVPQVLELPQVPVRDGLQDPVAHDVPERDV